MHLESTITGRVDTLVHNPVFAGGDQPMDLVLDDVEAVVQRGQSAR
jgi:hypothetical protein